MPDRAWQIRQEKVCMGRKIVELIFESKTYVELFLNHFALQYFFKT